MIVDNERGEPQHTVQTDDFSHFEVKVRSIAAEREAESSPRGCKGLVGEMRMGINGWECFVEVDVEWGEREKFGHSTLGKWMDCVVVKLPLKLGKRVRDPT